MITKVKDLLNKKHLLIVGKTEQERRDFVSELISKANLETFRFPAHITSLTQYLDFVKSEGLFSPWYDAKTYNNNQILDFHWDWISENNSLVVLEEIDALEDTWKYELLTTYINELESRKKGEKKIHLILSQHTENDLLEELSKRITISENENRTKKQVIEQHLEVVEVG